MSGVTRTSVLLLAGTTEAAELAGLLAGCDDVDVLASLAGRTQDPAILPGAVRRGGFGGIDGLATTLRDGGHDLLVDATHPFAAQMPHHAAAAASMAHVPRVRLLRPPWLPADDDRWHPVPDLPAAARRLEDLGARRVFLTTGRLELEPFVGLVGVHLVTRSIESPDPMPLPDATVVLDRGPFDVPAELALLRDHGIDTLVTKNSGGGATAAKLVAARQLGIRVVMVDRPATPAGPTVETPAEALVWIESHRPG